MPSGRGERRLLAAIRLGDRGAAEELVDRTYSQVYAALFRLCGEPQLAADLTQDTYRKAWEALPAFNGRSRFFTWLYRIAYHTFLNQLRRAPLLQLDDDEVAELADPSPLPDELSSRARDSEYVRRAVLELPEELRFMVTAHFWAGLDIREIAENEQVTTAAIRKRLHKAFSMLEEALHGNVEEERL